MDPKPLDTLIVPKRKVFFNVRKGSIQGSNLSLGFWPLDPCLKWPLVVILSPDLVKNVLHTHRELNLAPGLTMSSLTIFTGEGEDMVFTIYGDHWKRRRRIMTVPSPTR